METQLRDAGQNNSTKLWLARISKEEKAHKDWRDRAEEVEEIYRPDEDDPVMVPLLWSVISVEHAGIYSNQPVPDVRCRNTEPNPVYYQVATLIRRGLSYCVDHPSFDESMHRAVDDYLGVGMGLPRVKVDSIINVETTPVPMWGLDPMGNRIQVGMTQQTTEKVGDQTIRWEYVPWSRFGWEPCNEWKHCNWIYIRHPMTKAQCRQRFGKIPSGGNKDDFKGSTDSWLAQTIDIYEIWDKKKREVLFIAKGEDEPLEIRPDPLELLDFYPVPQPMMTNVGSEEILPRPDYDYIEQFDLEINRLQEKRGQLIEQIKACGAYDTGFPELGEILDLNDGQMKGIPNLAARLSQMGGPDNALWFAPIAEKAAVLEQTVAQIEFLKAQVDEFLGISDIVRGTTAASETATAQEIKGRWVGVRLTRKRETVIYTVKAMLRIMSQLLGSHITPDNLQRMTQMQITDEMMQILSNDVLMDFLIDIETDSTVAKDEFKEREVHQEMLNGVAQWAQSVAPMVQQNAIPADAASAMLRAALKPYARYDRALEETLEKLPTSMQQLQQLSQQLQQAQGELQNTQMQMQQWQQIATMLQQQATDAKAERDRADAQLKLAQAEKAKADTRETMSTLKLQPVREAAEIGQIREQTMQMSKNNGSSNGN